MDELFLTRRVLLEKAKTKWVMPFNNLALQNNHFQVKGHFFEVRDFKVGDIYKTHYLLTAAPIEYEQYGTVSYIITKGEYEGLCLLKKYCQIL